MPEDDDSWTVVDCGCGFGIVGDTFMFERCASDCPLYLFTLAEIARQGKPHDTYEL